MVRSRQTFVTFLTAVGSLLASCVLPPRGSAGSPAEPRPASPGSSVVRPSPFETRLHRSPLGTSLIVNGGFGEYRGGHFHAGLDLGTGRRTGRRVLAPESGWIERVRSSGVGYGRALYLRTRDDRTLEFGHLDAFAGPLAAFVEHAQDSTAHYEQDLGPPRGRFPVRAGDVIAWSGESGAGGPHLHFEIRRGDVAYNPVRAGLSLPDRVPPTLLELTLEPLDNVSQVEGRYGPYTLDLARTDTVSAMGRMRAIVRARDQTSRGGARTVPWSVGMEWNGRRTECRFDSVSWASDMPEADYVYDAGRVTGRKGLVLWAAAGFRPRVLRADAPIGEEAGTVEIRLGDPPRALLVWARDLGGRVVKRRVVVRPGKLPPQANPGWWRGEEPWDSTAAGFASFPGGFLRIGVPVQTAKNGLELQLGDEARRATRSDGVWSATFAVSQEARARTMRLPIALRAQDPAAAAVGRGGFVWARHASAADSFELADESGEVRVGLASGALFEDATLLAFALTVSAPTGLVSVGRAWQVEPGTLPLRRAARIAIAAPAGAPIDRIGLYRLDAGKWQWIGARLDPETRAVRGDSRRLGGFALFRDEVGPRITLLQPAAASVKNRPYSRWSVEATVAEEGSGIDAVNSYFELDGGRVPTEWDPDVDRLRWRPLEPPAPGTHAVVMVAADRAGNTTRATGTFRMGP